MWVIKIALISAFILVFWQDTKDRMVYWFLYPAIGILAFILQSAITGYISSLINSFLNLGLVGVLLTVAFFYCKIIMKKKFINESIGLGDILLFLFLSFTFSTLSFIVLLVFSLLFSLAVHIYMKNKSNQDTVPLAGYISIFFAVVYSISFFTQPKYLFAY